MQKYFQELEIALDHANKANADAQKNIKRYNEQVKELQFTIDQEQQRREEYRENYVMTEKRLAQAKQEQEEVIAAIDNVGILRGGVVPIFLVVSSFP